MGLWSDVRKDLRAHSHRSGIAALIGALLFSPGFVLIFSHRVAVFLYKKRWGKFFGRLLWRGNVLFSGCHLGLRSSIGAGVLMPHPVGIVIGDGVEIGDNAVIYQSVTIGAASFSKDEYPVIGENVIIYPGSVVVGRVKVGDGAVIGANSFVRSDVPSHAIFGVEQAHVYGVMKQ